MRVGLTGGVASGKSTVSAILDELGAVIIDADVLAREVVAKGTPGLDRVVAVAWSPSDVPTSVVVGIFVSAAGLALCGAVTGVLLMERMNAGHYYLPEGMRLPLPAFMRPDLRAPR